MSYQALFGFVRQRQNFKSQRNFNGNEPQHVISINVAFLQV